MQFIIWQWQTSEYPACYCLFLCRGIQPEHVTFCLVSSSMFTFIAVCNFNSWIHVVRMSLLLWASQTSANKVQHIFIVANYFWNDTDILRSLRPVEEIHVCAPQMKDLQQHYLTIDKWMDEREDPGQGLFIRLSTASLAQSMRTVFIKYQLSISINFCRCFLRFKHVDLGSRVYDICI